MTVEQAIEKLKGLAISPRSSTHEEALALSMAISALEKEKEQALQEAKTSSNNNNSISNDNTKLKICQEEIDYKSKYIKCSNLLCLTELRIKKIYQLLNNVWEDFASVDIDQSQFIGAACLKEMPPKTKEQKAALRLLSEYDRLFDFINIALDYTYDIKKSLEENNED